MPCAPTRREERCGTRSETDTLATLRDFDADQRLDYAERTYQTVRYSASTWPHLLVEIDNLAGKVTTVDYATTAAFPPVGDTAAGQMPAHHVVVHQVASEDLHTGQTASIDYDYRDGHLVDGGFQGFGGVEKRVSFNGTLSRVVDATYDLSSAREPRLRSQSTSIDVERCYLPDLVGPDCEPTFEVVHQLESFAYTPPCPDNDAYRLTHQQVSTTWGEEPGPPGVVTVDFTFDACRWSSVTVDAGPDVPRSTTTFGHAVDDARALSRLAWKQVSDGDGAVLRYSEYLYDGEPLGSVRDGFLSQARQCIGPHFDAATGSCREFAETFMEPTARGQAWHVYTDAGASETHTFTFGDAVVESTTNALGHRVDNVVDLKGRVTMVTDVDGVSTLTHFDDFDRPELVQKRSAAPGADWIDFGFPEYLVKSEAEPLWTRHEILMEGGVEVSDKRWELDGSGNVMRTWTQEPGGSWYRQDFLHDLAGRLLMTSPETKQDLDSGLPLDFSRVLERHVYDGLGRARISRVDHDAEIGIYAVFNPAPNTYLTYGQEGGAGAVPLDHMMRKLVVRDGLGRLREVREGSDELVQTGDYAYDAAGQLTRLTLGNGDTFHYQYDTAGRQTLVQRAGSPSAEPVNWYRWTYDGRYLDYRVDGTGGWVHYASYDLMDRLTRYEVSDPLDGERAFDIDYDLEVDGLVSQLHDPRGTTVVTYDDFAHEATKTRTYIKGPPDTVTYATTRDLHDRVVQRTHPSGTVLDYELDHGFLMATHVQEPVSSGGDTYSIHRTYGAEQRALHELSAPITGLVATFERAESQTRLSGIDFAINGVRTTRDLTYENDGFIASIVRDDGQPGRREYTYVYDTLGRLESASINGVLDTAYSYDNAGGDVLYLFHESAGVSSWTYSYPAPGSYEASQGLRKPQSRTSAAGTETFTYDDAGRMSTWTDTSGVTQRYRYDGLGRLRTVSVDGVLAQSYHYDAVGKIVETERRRGKVPVWERHFESWRGTRVGPAGFRTAQEDVAGLLTLDVSEPSVTTRLWKVHDVFGDVAKTYHDNPIGPSDVVGERVLGVIGHTLSQTGTPFDSESFHGTRFTGDTPGGQLFYMGQRHLARRDGMWLQPEPLLIAGASEAELLRPQHLAAYRYAGNNPVNLHDRTGLVVESGWDGAWVMADIGFIAVDLTAGNYGAAAWDSGILALDVGATFVPGLPAFAGPLAHGAGAASKGAGLLKRGACFVEGTTVRTPSGGREIQDVGPGDRVIASDAAAVSETPRRAACESSASRPHRGTLRVAAAACAALAMGACEPEPPVPDAVVEVYQPSEGSWTPMGLDEAEVGAEVHHDGHLYQVTLTGLELLGPVSDEALRRADVAASEVACWRAPDAEDWVLVLGAGHSRLDQVAAGQQVALDGRVWKVTEDGVEVTGDVIGRVVDTFVRMAPEVIDAEVAFPDGTTTELTGTPNHAFWVDAMRDYVPLGRLEVGTVLHVQGGGEAILVSKTWRQGDFEVFDFEVEDLHNFYVGDGSDDWAILVHNSTIDIRKFDFGSHLRGLIGAPPAGMKDPHAHHVLFKIGNRDAQKALVKQGQDILRSVGIDPIFRKEVLGWAPNRVKGQHCIEALQPLVERLQETADAGGGYEEMVKVLDFFKDIAAGRGT